MAKAAIAATYTPPWRVERPEWVMATADRGRIFTTKTGRTLVVFKKGQMKKITQEKKIEFQAPYYRIDLFAASSTGDWFVTVEDPSLVVKHFLEDPFDDIVFFRSDSPVHSVDISPHDHWVAVGTSNGTVRVLYATTMEVRQTFDVSPNSPVISVHFLGKNKEGDKDYLFAATLDEKMQLWNVAPQEGRNVIKRESPVGPVRHVEESGGDLFAVVGLDGRMTVVRRQDGMSIDVPPIGPVIGKAFFIGRHTVIALTYGNLINVWNCMTGERAVVEYEGEEIIDISLSANRELFARIVRRADGDGLGKLLVEHAPKFQWNGLVKD